MIEENIIDYNRCMIVVKILNDFFKNQVNLANIDFPSNIEYKSNDYLLYMFYSCLLDYGMRSKIYHKNLIETYEMYPNIFNPYNVIKMKEEFLKDIIVNNIHPRYPNVATQKWIRLSKKLVPYENMQEHLRKMKSFEELKYFIKNIKEYGQKTGGLLLRIICDSNVCSFKENTLSIPIDRHDIEISYLTGIILDKSIKDKEIKKLSDAYVKIGKELQINPSDIDKYLWEVGNSFCNKIDCLNCPLNNLCKGSDKNERKYG